jgi:hypothetical protein
MHINLHYQQDDRDSTMQTKLNNLQQQLMQLWAIHGGENGSARLMAMEHRAVEVLREVSRQGWQDYWSDCEDTAKIARHLWQKCETLVIAA